jgi:hypothetical protein
LYHTELSLHRTSWYPRKGCAQLPRLLEVSQDITNTKDLRIRNKRQGMRLILFILGISLTHLVNSAGIDTQGPTNLADECSSHKVCRNDQFCRRILRLSEPNGVILPFTSCKPCSQCTCHDYAVDGACPPNCGVPAQEVLQLSGVWYGSTSNGCLQIWTFNDLGFTSVMQPDILTSTGHYASTASSPTVEAGHKNACAKSKALTGAKAHGWFTLDTSVYPARLTATYLDYKGPVDFAPLVRRASVLTACPEVRMCACIQRLYLV